MADGNNGKSRLWVIWLVFAVAAAAIAAAGLLWPGNAKVEGATPRERIASIGALADNQPRGAGDAIAVAAADDPDPMVRRAALLTLERFVASKYRPVVESALTDPDERVRAGAAATLGRFGDNEAADRLQKLRVNDPSQAVRLAVVAGLAKNPAAKATVHLVQAMENSTNAEVQLRARRALAQRFDLPLTRSVGPDDPRWWPNDVELIKELPAVISAFRVTQTPLKLSPAHVIPDPDGDTIPERKKPPPPKK